MAPTSAAATKTRETLKNWRKSRELLQKKHFSLLAIFVLSVVWNILASAATFWPSEKLSFWIFQYRFSQICLDLKSLQCPDLYVRNSSLYCFLGERPRRGRMSNRKSKIYGTQPYSKIYDTPPPYSISSKKYLIIIVSVSVL